MNATQEFFKVNTKKNSRSKNTNYWYADPLDRKNDRSSRSVHRNRLAELLENQAVEVKV